MRDKKFFFVSNSQPPGLELGGVASMKALYSQQHASLQSLRGGYTLSLPLRQLLGLHLWEGPGPCVIGNACLSLVCSEACPGLEAQAVIQGWRAALVHNQCG